MLRCGAWQILLASLPATLAMVPLCDRYPRVRLRVLEGRIGATEGGPVDDPARKARQDVVVDFVAVVGGLLCHAVGSGVDECGWMTPGFSRGCLLDGLAGMRLRRWTNVKMDRYLM